MQGSMMDRQASMAALRENRSFSKGAQSFTLSAAPSVMGDCYSLSGQGPQSKSRRGANPSRHGVDDNLPDAAAISTPTSVAVENIDLPAWVLELEPSRMEYAAQNFLALEGVQEILSLQEEMIEELADLSWGDLPIPNPTTASLEAVVEKVPYYILKQIGKQRRIERCESAGHLAYRTCRVLGEALKMMLRLMVLNAVRTPNFTVDATGGYFRKGVKRELDALYTSEPGEGGVYEWLANSDHESQTESWSDESDDGMDVQDPCFRRVSSLNGSHGEVTETDDFKKNNGSGRRRGRGGGTGGRQASSVPTRRRKGPSRQVQNAKKVMAREAAVAVASNFVGAPMARMGYRLAAKSLGAMNRFGAKTLVLSEHASRYLLSFVKPFDQAVQQVSVPRPPATRSFKVTGYIRGSGQIGANGIGFVAVAPTLTNDRPCAYYTTAQYTPTVTGAPPSDFAYTSPTFQQGGTLFPGAAFMSNLPYATNQLNTTSGGTGSVNEITGRIVSCSMRLYYTGTTFNEGGNYYAYSDPDVNNVLGADHTSAAVPSGYSTANLLSKDATEIIKVKGRSEASLVRICTDPNMDDYPRANASALRKMFPYSGGEYYTNGADTYNGVANMVIMIDGTAAQPFYFEVVTHAEYIGPGVVQGLLSDTNNDAVGYDCVKNLLQHAQRRVASDPRLTFKDALEQEMKRQGVRMGTGQRSVDY